MGKIAFNRPLQLVDQISGETADVKVLQVEACDKFAGYDVKVTCNWLTGSEMDAAVLVTYVNSVTGACADHEGCPLRGRMSNKDHSRRRVDNGDFGCYRSRVWSRRVGGYETLSTVTVRFALTSREKGRGCAPMQPPINPSPSKSREFRGLQGKFSFPLDSGKNPD